MEAAHEDYQIHGYGRELRRGLGSGTTSGIAAEGRSRNQL
jgi:hypothetical protein